MIKTLAHVCLLVADLQRTEDFYTGILGLAKKFDFFRGDQWIGYYLQVDDRRFIEVFADASGAEEFGGKKRITHFCLEVEDIQTIHDVLVARDMAVTAPKLGADQSWQIWCKDPDGVDIEFHQYTPTSSQITGKKCLVDW